MPQQDCDALVIGAGVSGLTTAVCLAEVGFRVRVVAQKPPMATTSAVAGANWGPFLATDSRIVGWSRITRNALESIAVKVPSAGVSLVRGLEVNSGPASPPSWAQLVPDFSVADKVPDGYQAGWWFTAPIADMVRYLDYLESWLAQHGVYVEVATVNSFEEAHSSARLVVNCSGLGARTLAHDPLVYPVRGQLVVVPNPGVDYFFQNDVTSGELTYFMPQGSRVVLGGCATDHDERTAPDKDVAEGIVARCAAVEPALRGLPVIEQRVGLRPARSTVRVEVDWVAGRPVIHNYGHGGSGLTLSWGCASTVLAYARALTALDHRGRRSGRELDQRSQALEARTPVDRREGRRRRWCWRRRAAVA